nr:MAG TPA: hypothetical protein [Bacteriophage sp.]DAX09943.1 MAG TPA: hypothetical protein [Bacteriophage sp.]
MQAHFELFQIIRFYLLLPHHNISYFHTSWN